MHCRSRVVVLSRDVDYSTSSDDLRWAVPVEIFFLAFLRTCRTKMRRRRHFDGENVRCQILLSPAWTTDGDDHHNPI